MKIFHYISLFTREIKHSQVARKKIAIAINVILVVKERERKKNSTKEM